MHNPLVIEAIMLIAAIIVGVWSQRALPLHVDSRPILFLLCLFLGTGSALCLLLDILALLLTGQVATGGVRCCCWWCCGNLSTGLSASLKILCSGEPKREGQRPARRRSTLIRRLRRGLFIAPFAY